MAKKPLTLRRQSSGPAYTLVDLSSLHKTTRKDIMEDALLGGGTYGIRIVEESVNGAARAPIYGYYKNGPDAERWENAKKELGLDATDIPDGEVAAIDVEVHDPRREAALREAAAQRANAEADKIRAGEAEALREITGEDTDDDQEVAPPNPSADRAGATDGHPTNIVDTTLAEDATNEASDAESSKKATSNRRQSNKAPK